MMLCVELSVAHRREVRPRLGEYARHVRLVRRVERPRSIALAVRVAGPGKIGPSGHEFVRQLLLPGIQGMWNSLRTAMPARKQIGDVGGMIGERLKSRHDRE